MQIRRSNTQARLEFVQNVVLLVFALTGWGMCLSIYVWANGETPDAQLNGRVWTIILGCVFFLIALWEVWKTSPIHLHVVWHRHYFVAETKGYDPPFIEDGRRWMRESGLNDPIHEPTPQGESAPAWLDPNADASER